MATICKKCGGIVADIYPPGTRHECGAKTNEFISGKRPNKCGMCGSTAVDHTEAQCAMNRALNNLAQLPQKGRNMI
jgi:hypothetical protein